MWEQLLGTMMNGAGAAGGAGLGALGQAAGNIDLQGLISALGQPQPRSGAVGIPQQQQQPGMVLPPKPGSTVQSTPWDSLGDVQVGPAGVPLNEGMQDPQDMFPINGGVQKQPMSQGGATGIPNQAQPQGGQPQGMEQGQGVNWGSLLGMGTRDSPNALVRLGEGYNSGGLIGALGYLLTDMSKQANGTTQQGF